MTKIQKNLLKELKKKNQDLKYAIFGKCYDCTGFQADGYQNCEIETCPLYPFRLKQAAGLTSQSLASFLKGCKTRIQL